MMTNEEIQLLEDHCINKSRQDFYCYRQYISNFKLKTGWFIKNISQEIQIFYEDYKAGKRPILVIQAPPQHGKSEAVMDGIAWMAGKDPRLRFIYASFSERLGIRANLKLQRLMTRDKYNNIFPKTYINTKNILTSIGYQKNKSMIEFIGTDGSFRNTTVRGSITGETLDIGVIDDPIKGREEANSSIIRDKTWNWFNDDFMTRFDEYGALLIILTRWHVDDPIGRLLNQNKKVKLLSFKAIADDDEEYRAEGEPLFPEHKSLEFLMSRKNSMSSSNWESLYQQNPVIPGGGIFKDEWWKYYKVLPALKYRKIFVDTAQKTKEEHDYSVFQCWGYDNIGNCYLIDQVRGKWESPELIKTGQAFWLKHKVLSNNKVGTLRKMVIEDKASGTGLIQTLKKGDKEKNISKIPVEAKQRNIDKVTRAHDAVPIMESGFVFLPEGNELLSDYLHEFRLFPNARHDDQVDPTLDAIDEIINKPNIDWNKML